MWASVVRKARKRFEWTTRRFKNWAGAKNAGGASVGIG